MLILADKPTDPTNRIVSTSYTIVDTDYDTYAVDVECQSWWVVRRVSATILARNKTLPADLIQEVSHLDEEVKLDDSLL